MPRIRTIKPEFWVDEKVVDLSFAARLLFIGLWNFADDQGYVDYSPKRIRMQVFPGDQVDVEALLGELTAAGVLRAYESPVGPVLHITNWTKHQRIDKAGRARFEAEALRPFPTPPRAVIEESANPPRTFVESSGSPREHSRADLEVDLDLDPEGKGKEVRPTAGREIATAQPDTTQALVGEWIDACRKRPPNNVIGQVAKQIKVMLGEGIDPADLRAGFIEWHRKGMHPSTLPSVVNEVMNASPVGSSRPGSGPKPSTTDQRVGAALALAAKYAEEDAS